jgi:phosphatidylethanolamine-binding protein (PEBP) family uncharacterized protein
VLEHLPSALGQALKGVRPGVEKLTFHSSDFGSAPETITVTSKAFADGEPIPARYTEDGAKLSPPLAWTGIPSGAAAVVKNSFFKAEFLPPDPPSGHGPHRYAFQVFAIDQPLAFDDEPGRGALIEGMRGHVLAKGCLTGVYERA